MNNEKEFQEWLGQVDVFVRKTVGLVLSDLADWPSRDCFNSGAAPWEGAREALEASGWNGKVERPNPLREMLEREQRMSPQQALEAGKRIYHKREPLYAYKMWEPERGGGTRRFFVVWNAERGMQWGQNWFSASGLILYWGSDQWTTDIQKSALARDAE